MMRTESIRTVIGIIGNVISFFLFLSPVPTFVNICKAKSVQSFKPDPYLATILNCVMWVWYGMPFIHPDSTLVVTINGIGFFIELAYISIFFIYSDWPKRRKILMVLLVEAIFMAVVVVVTLVATHKIHTRTVIVGALCVFFNIGMYTSPLTIMSQVIRTKSVKFMPFYLSVANFANGGIWTVYALLKFDIWLFVPNLLGAISGAVQLILYACYYKTTQREDNNNGAGAGGGASNNGVELQNSRVSSLQV